MTNFNDMLQKAKEMQTKMKKFKMILKKLKSKVFQAAIWLKLFCQVIMK